MVGTSENYQVVSLAPPAIIPLTAQEQQQIDNDMKSMCGKYKSCWTSMLLHGFVRQVHGDVLGTENIDLMALIRSWCSWQESIDAENSDKEWIQIERVAAPAPDEESEVIACTAENMTDTFHVFGTNLYTKGQRCVWRFRIKQNWSILIGIIDAEHIDELALLKQGMFAENKEINGYAVCTMDCTTYRQSTVPWKKLWEDGVDDEDVIEMCLDLTETEFEFGTLSYTKNGVQNLQTAFKGIASSKEYKLCLAMRGGDQSIAILRT
eukprot:CAMPEP_0202710350 /NCGR_PEP_ID=MMETSP1385-20130828/22345_1 /ASSEMBLY_ACC=CAM_ASM_000861 /TAXON_ID=933848 /ORGANISM="Elphidium margaritaceum" /LENGTH=264 /DNA_ID=CAMNT_0049369871 /DNA_START=39 /DNA_END=833 /DNA_ORIENTATION=-